MGDKKKGEEVNKMEGIFKGIFGKKKPGGAGNAAASVQETPSEPAAPKLPSWLAEQQATASSQARAIVADVLGDPDSGAHMSGTNVRSAAEGERAAADKANTERLRKLTGRG